MGANVRQIKWGVSILILSLIIVISFGDYQNVRRNIYFEHHSKISLGYVFGYLPNDYHEKFSEDILEENKAYTLTSISYNLSPIENYRYIILTNENNKLKLLLDIDAFYEDTGDFKNLLAPALNIEFFNEFLKLKNSSDDKAIKLELI